MKNKLFYFLFLLFTISSQSQNIIILKDSVLVDSKYFILEDLKINIQDEIIQNNIYKITQNSFNLFDLPFPILPEERVKMKKDTITKYVLEDQLKESNAGFEHFEIYFNRDNFLNMSISIQSYGSAWESIQYYCFDLTNGSNLGEKLFINQKKLLKKIKKNLKQQDLNIAKVDLNNYKIISDENNFFTGIDFIFFDTENYKNGGYEEYITHFNLNEIKKFISPSYCKIF